MAVLSCPSVTAWGSDSGGGYSGPKTVELAIDLPMQGGELPSTQPIVEGIKLALKDAGSKAGAITVQTPVVYDDALNGGHDPATGAANIGKAVATADVMAVVGPLNSSVAEVEIPVSNQGGLFQCSPSNTNPGPTKLELGAGDLHPKPQALNYVRVVTTDDVQGPAAARFVHDTLHATKVYVIDDGESYGVDLADAFAAEFEKEGGTVVKRDSAPSSSDTPPDYAPLLTAAAALGPQAIFYGGITATGGPEVLLAAHNARGRRRPDPHLRHAARQAPLRCQRRHLAEDHLVLQRGPERGRRQGRLGVRGSARLRRHEPLTHQRERCRQHPNQRARRLEPKSSLSATRSVEASW